MALADLEVGLVVAGRDLERPCSERWVDRFVGDAKTAGFDALIIPDLPPPEAGRVCEGVRAGGPIATKRGWAISR